MKRDMELVRSILLFEEGDDEAKKVILEHYRSNPEAAMTVVHHYAILMDADYLQSQGLGHDGDWAMQQVMAHALGTGAYRLTWSGHEFLDTIREDRVWKATKEKVLKTGASWTMSMLVEVAKVEIRKHLGLP